MKTSNRTNALGQPIGEAVPAWQPATAPGDSALEGRTCKLVRADPQLHADSLWSAIQDDLESRMWTYLSYGPFDDLDDYRDWMERTCLSEDPCFYAIVDRSTLDAVGLASYLRISPADGVIEVGHLQYSPRLQRTTQATEAMYLMMRHAFEELGYRRYEWKCDALNAPSRAAAERLGFRFEGIFRQATIYKARNRDTAWYSILDSEWPGLRSEFDRWLAADNFDDLGRQRTVLHHAAPSQGSLAPGR